MDEVWFVDAAPAFHTCKDRRKFAEYQALQERRFVTGIARRQLRVYGLGVVRLRVRASDGAVNTLELRDVRYVRACRSNLISTTALRTAGVAYYHGLDDKLRDPYTMDGNGSG
jgi:hypothetical protein